MKKCNLIFLELLIPSESISMSFLKASQTWTKICVAYDLKALHKQS